MSAIVAPKLAAVSSRPGARVTGLQAVDMLEPAILGQAAIMARHGYLESAGRLVAQLIEDGCTLPAAFDLLARIRAQQYRIIEAKALWQQALVLEPGNREYVAGLKQCDRVRSWRSRVYSSRALYPLFYRYYRFVGNGLIKASNPVEAAELLRHKLSHLARADKRHLQHGEYPYRLAAAEAGYCDALSHRADVFEARGQADNAGLCFSVATSIVASSTDAWARWGSHSFRQCRYDHAASCYRRVIALDERNAEAWGDLGHCMLSTDHHQEALECYERALGAGGKEPSLYMAKALCLILMGRYPEALDCYEAGTRLFPRDALLWLGRARTQSMLGRQEDADRSIAVLASLASP